MALNVDRRQIAFSKVKNFTINRKKQVRFSLPRHLEKEACLMREARLLGRGYDGSLPPLKLKSDVWKESYDEENPTQVRPRGQTARARL